LYAYISYITPFIFSFAALVIVKARLFRISTSFIEEIIKISKLPYIHPFRKYDDYLLISLNNNVK
jgi:hypothetical protein